MVSQELVKELQIIIKEDYGKELELDQVSLIANDLVGYFDLLAKIYHEIHSEKNNENYYYATKRKH